MQTKKKVALAGGCVLAGAVAAIVLINTSLVASDAETVSQNIQATENSTGQSQSFPASNKAVAQVQKSADKSAADISTEPEVQELSQIADSNPDYATLADRAQEISARRNGQPVDAKALKEAIAQDAAWRPLDGAPAGFPLTAEEQMDGREFIQINPMKIESLVPGDTFEMDIAQINRSFTAVIDDVQVGESNNVTWVGHLKDLENESRVVFTRGETLIVGGMTTPHGHFEMETRGEYGWIANSATLFKTPDVLVEVPADELAKTPAVLPPGPVVEDTL